MRFYIFLLATLLFLTACGGGNDTPKTNDNVVKPTVSNLPANNPIAGNNAPTTQTTPIPAPTTKPEAPKTNDAATLKSVVTAYSEALKTKNDAMLKKVLSQSTIKGWEDEMKSEGKTKLAEYIAETEYIEGKPYELRNEEIKGDEASAEIKGGTFGNWEKIKFVKENGEWKMTDESASVENVIKNANTAQKIK